MSAAPALSIRGLTKRFGGLTAVDHLDLDLEGGKLNAIIGPNGAGKTTLFNLVSALLRADEGQIIFNNKDLARLKPQDIVRAGVSRTLQIKSVFGGLSVEDNVRAAVLSHERIFGVLRPAKSYRAVSARVDDILDEIGMSAAKYRLANTLPYGDLVLLEMGMALANEPKLLLLDEPICGMSPSETERTVEKIKALSKRTNVVLIEHDMEVVFAIADNITVMANGRLLARGTPKEIAADAQVQDVYLGSPDDED